MKPISSPHHSDSSYLGAQIVDHTRGLAVDEPYRDMHGTKVIRLWKLKPKPRKVVGQQRSDDTFAILPADTQIATCLIASSLEKTNGRAGIHTQRISVLNPKHVKLVVKPAT